MTFNESEFELVKKLVDLMLEQHGRNGYPVAVGYLEGKLSSLLIKIKDVNPELYEEECNGLSSTIVSIEHLIKYPFKEEL
jgi:hypothetical protein